MPTTPQGTADKPVRHWFITGAAGGLGHNLAHYALGLGDRVTATVRAPPRSTTCAAGMANG
jgi:NAD(P)-dependent dehydrogenase (short-subunit alcohol dehydrogenase family)